MNYWDDVSMNAKREHKRVGLRNQLNQINLMIDWDTKQ